MQKIMFNDKFCLTELVLNEKKTMTRRIEKSLDGIDDAINNLGFTRFDYKSNGMVWLWNDKTKTFLKIEPRYKIGEIVDVAQNYSKVREFYHRAMNWKLSAHGTTVCDLDLVKDSDIHKWVYEEFPLISHTAGWNNKMFVKAELMPHQIQITGIKIEHLQDISDEDCIKEGIIDMNSDIYRYAIKKYPNEYIRFGTPREAYAALIDKICGKGTWESNPFVVAYEFKLIR